MMILDQNKRLPTILFVLIMVNLAGGLAFQFQQGFRNSVPRLMAVLLVLLIFYLDGLRTDKDKLSLPLAFSWAGVVGMIAYRPFRIPHDSAMYLDIGRRVLSGEIPYIDFIEINPPTIYYLSAVVMWIAKTVNLHPMPVFLLSITVLIILIVFICAKSLRSGFPDLQISTTRLFALVLGFSALLFLLANSFGQREHIFVLLIFPWLLFRWKRWQGHPVKGGWAVGLACALAVTLKPHFILFPIILEVYWIIERRSLRELISVEWMVVLLCAIAYSLGLFLPVDIRQGIVKDILPMVRSGGYAAYGNLGAYTLLILVTIQGTPLIALLPWIPGLIADEKIRSLLRTFSIFSFVSILIYILQDKGWDYQFIPAITGSVAIILFLSYYGLASGPLPRRNKWGGSLLLLLLVPILLIAPVRKFPELGVWEQEVSTYLLDYSQKDDSVIVVTNVTDPYLATVEHERRQVATYNVAFPVAIEYSGEPYNGNPVLTGFARKYVEALEQDIIIHTPTLIMIEHYSPCLACPEGFTYAAFLADTGFSSTILEPDYTRLDVDARFYDVWVRTETLPAK